MLSLGIDIGSFSIKVAKVRSLPKGFEVIALSEYPLPQDPNKDQQIDIIEALRDIQKRYWEEGTQVVAGAHQYDVSLRRKEFPFRERHKILKSLPFELEDDTPLSIENSVFDGKITHFTGNTAHILAVACPKSHIQEILRKFSDGGFYPDIVSVDSIASSNLFEEWREGPWEYPAAASLTTERGSTDVVIDLGHKTSTVAIIKDGYILDVRLLDWGGKDIAEAIAQRYSMHYLEALKELKRRAFILTNNEGATKDQIALSEVIKTSVDQLAQKLRLVLLELQASYQIDFRQAILTGGVSQLRNIGAYLTQRTEVATNRLGKLDMISSIDFGASPNNEIAAITAIGLATEGLKRPKNPAINLLKGDFAKQNQSLQVFWENWGPTVKLTAICFALILVWGAFRDSFTYSNSELAYDTLKTRGKKILDSKRVSDSDIKRYIREQENKLKLKETIDGLQNINSALDILKKISGVAPTGKGTANAPIGLNVREFKVTRDTVVLTGEASTAETIKNLESALRSVAIQNKIQAINPPSARSAGYKSFGYQFKMERRSAQ